MIFFWPTGVSSSLKEEYQARFVTVDRLYSTNFSYKSGIYWWKEEKQASKDYHDSLKGNSMPAMMMMIE